MDEKTIRSVSRFLKPLGNIIKGKSLRRAGQRAILMYHGISRQPGFNCISTSLFEEHLGWLKERYNVVPLSVLVEDLGSTVMPDTKNLAAITFDDCYVSFAELALPILRKYNVHATVFMPTGKVEQYNDWDEGMAGFCKMQIMSYSMLRQLPEDLVEIGSHGISHSPLNQMAYGELEKEVVQSRIDIEHNTGRPVRFFAFPFGMYPFKYRHRLYDGHNRFLGGYRAACGSSWGRFNEMKDICMLHRITIADSDSFDDFQDKLNGHYDWLTRKESVGRYYKIMKSWLQ
jgi:peptidoglycan/xylan/chitin deacetylase (PgdA/CDA1 family)